MGVVRVLLMIKEVNFMTYYITFLFQVLLIFLKHYFLELTIDQFHARPKECCGV